MADNKPTRIQPNHDFLFSPTTAFKEMVYMGSSQISNINFLSLGKTPNMYEGMS